MDVCSSVYDHLSCITIVTNIINNLACKSSPVTGVATSFTTWTRQCRDVLIPRYWKVRVWAIFEDVMTITTRDQTRFWLKKEPLKVAQLDTDGLIRLDLLFTENISRSSALRLVWGVTRVSPLNAHRLSWHIHTLKGDFCLMKPHISVISPIAHGRIKILALPRSPVVVRRWGTLPRRTGFPDEGRRSDHRRFEITPSGRSFYFSTLPARRHHRRSPTDENRQALPLLMYSLICLLMCTRTHCHSEHRVVRIKIRLRNNKGRVNDNEEKTAKEPMFVLCRCVAVGIPTTAATETSTSSVSTEWITEGEWATKWFELAGLGLTLNGKDTSVKDGLQR